VSPVDYIFEVQYFFILARDPHLDTIFLLKIRFAVQAQGKERQKNSNQSFWKQSEMHEHRGIRLKNGQGRHRILQKIFVTSVGSRVEKY